MAKRRRRPSLLGALLWIGLGLLFLLRNFGVGPDFWSLAGRYWPILLILVGLGKVLDYFLQKDAVSIRIGEIVGILLLLIAGTAISRISRGPFGRLAREFPIEIGGTSVRPGQWIGESHTYSEEVTYPLDPSMPIHIENSYGLVSVAPGSDRELRVRLKKVIYSNETRARKIASEIHLEAAPDRKSDSSAPIKPEAEPGKNSNDGSVYFVVKTNREDLDASDFTFNTDMEVFVPKNAQVQVRNSFGEVRVAEINGALDLSTTRRALEVRDCTGQFTISTLYAECRLTNLVGNIQLDSRSRGRVYLENIKGDVRVTSEYSPLEIFGVDGKVELSSTEGNLRVEKVTKPVVIDARGSRVKISNVKDHIKVTGSNGNVDISDVDSDVTVEGRYAPLTLKNIGGNIDISSNASVSADDARGRLTLRIQGSRARLNRIKGLLNVQAVRTDVTVNDFEDACTITNEYSPISISTRHLGQGDVAVKNRNGDVDLFLPESASFLIDATARNGKVESDFAGLEPVSDGSGETLKSRVKSGKPKIVLETDYGNIHIYRTGSGKSGPSKRAEAARTMSLRKPAISRWPALLRKAPETRLFHAGVRP